MRISFRLLLLLPALQLAACERDDLPTAPDSPASPGQELSAAAATLVVNSLADPGNGICNAQQCTLREAIEDSRSSAITFASGLTGIITLARPGAGGGTLVINKALSITGPAGRIIVSRRTTDPAFRILTVGTDGNVSLRNLALRNGKTDRNGGGISNFGTLSLRNCLVSDNTAATGGGIDNHGPLTITQTTIEHNTGFAGGIHNHLRRVIIRNSSVRGNSGGGLFNGGGSLEITNSTISNNSRVAITQDWGGTTLDHVRIMGNLDGGITNHQGRVILTNSTIADNSSSVGGGIFNSAGGFISVVSSTVSHNTASESGGGIFNSVGDSFGRLSAFVELINSTVSGNSADIGGGIENRDELGGAGVSVINSTIARNRARTEGGGVHNGESGDRDNPNSIFFSNSLVALNAAPTAPDVANGAARFSLIGNGTGSGISNTDGNQVGTSGSPINPRLGSLANNGGPTRTHALLAGSPAIDAAYSADCPATDQRGVSRPQGAGCDMGSYER